MQQPFMLFVDDDPEEREIVAEIFESFGILHLLRTVENAKDALAFLDNAFKARQLPKFLILDINMPGMNGVELLKQINLSGRYHESDIIMHSNDSSAFTQEICRKLGATSFITKSPDNQGLKMLAKKISQANSCQS